MPLLDRTLALAASALAVAFLASLLSASPARADVPPSMHGTWDTSAAACADPDSVAKLRVGPDRLGFHYGYADIVETVTKGPVTFVRGRLYQEGQVDGGDRKAFYRLEHLGGTDALGFKWHDLPRVELVRCAARQAEDTTQRRDPAPPEGIDGEPVGSCGHYVLLGAARTQKGAIAMQDRMGAGAGGVIESGDIPRFRGGFHLVILGPFASLEVAEARLAEWKGRVPDAYIKSGCARR